MEVDRAHAIFLARVNSVMFYLLWTCAPILVSIISFTTYVLQGNELDIPTAFTVIIDLLQYISSVYSFSSTGYCFV
jgi:hypothetical protein